MTAGFDPASMRRREKIIAKIAEKYNAKELDFCVNDGSGNPFVVIELGQNQDVSIFISPHCNAGGELQSLSVGVHGKLFPNVCYDSWVVNGKENSEFVHIFSDLIRAKKVEFKEKQNAAIDYIQDVVEEFLNGD